MMNGIINVLKPPGMTSNDVVTFIRKITGIKKVGHTGTLDPGAAGVLPVCIGKSTKIVDYIMKDKKTYICELTLGNSTDTYDKYGAFQNIENMDVPVLNEDDIKGLLINFNGVISQKPPAFSAIKLQGRRAYDLAREGITVDIPERKVTIYSIELMNFNKNTIMLKIVCSKGTYIRSICNDIGAALGCGAYMSFLIRSGTGIFNLNNCSTLEELKLKREKIEDVLIPPDKCLNMKSVIVPNVYKNKLLNGNSISLENKQQGNDNDYVKIYLEDSCFIGIGKINQNILLVEKLLI